MDHDLFIRLACVYITAGSLFYACNHLAELLRKERAGLPPDDDDTPPLMESLRKIFFWPAHVWPFRK